MFWATTTFKVTGWSAELAEALKAWTNAQVGKIQRLANVVVVESMPRSEIGKILKRELRDRHPALP